MGFVRKITGVQGQIDATNRAADIEAKNAAETARASADALNQSAAALAQNQKMLAERAKVEEAANSAMSRPLATADVQLAEAPTMSGAESSRRRRAKFGRGSASVSI